MLRKTVFVVEKFSPNNFGAKNKKTISKKIKETIIVNEKDQNLSFPENKRNRSNNPKKAPKKLQKAQKKLNQKKLKKTKLQ